jgi:hypothetical protein
MEIEFRAWDGENMYNPTDIVVYLGKGFVESPSFDPERIRIIQGISVELMQYTGLKDKNGKKIFEGDILSSTRDDKLIDWVIVYKAPAFMVRNITNEYLYKVDSIDFSDRQVMGNIYENKGLLSD